MASSTFISQRGVCINNPLVFFAPVCEVASVHIMFFFFSPKVLSINEEGLRRCEENTKVFGRPIR